jgi:hypothetical protein
MKSHKAIEQMGFCTEGGCLDVSPVVRLCRQYEEALCAIAAIEDRLVGGDWDEINEARELARKALS